MPHSLVDHESCRSSLERHGVLLIAFDSWLDALSRKVRDSQELLSTNLGQANLPQDVFVRENLDVMGSSTRSPRSSRVAIRDLRVPMFPPADPPGAAKYRGGACVLWPNHPSTGYVLGNALVFTDFQWMTWTKCRQSGLNPDFSSVR